MVSATRCIVCHRVGKRGGTSGPDLTSLARRFSPRDILVSILDPSKVVSEKYRNEAFELKDGRVIVGRVLTGDYRLPSLHVVPDLLAPEKMVTFLKTDIENNSPVANSPMPTDLLNTLSKEEILDLLAYLIAAGDSKHPVFGK